MKAHQAEKLKIKLLNGRRVLVQINHPTSKYHGSIVQCHIPYYPNYYPEYNYQISAPELSRKLNFSYLSLNLTNEKYEKLTTQPAFKKRIDAKDFGGRILEVHDVLFGNDKLIRIDNILPSGACQTTCIKAIISSNEGKKHSYRSLKRYCWIEDPTMLILSM